MVFALLFSAFVISTCGLVYELIAGALASYLLGDSVTQFSTVIGAYLFSMGIGSYLSKFISRDVVRTFIKVEMLVGLVGGCSAALLFVLFERVASFRFALYLNVGLIGILVGLEIPLLMRILKGKLEFKELVSRVFTFDYVGALAASILFPLLLVPHLGLVRTCFMFGAFNVLVAVWMVGVFRAEVGRLAAGMWATAAGILVLLVLGFAYSEKIMTFAEEAMYPARVVYAKTSPYQRIVLTHSGEDVRLYLNGHLQFSSRDEYRYHEGLVHPGLQSVVAANSGRKLKALVLGGGDGMALREVLRYPGVGSARLVDLDGEMTKLFRGNEFLKRLNGAAFEDARVTLTNADAFVWLKQNRDLYDFIVVDFPDPTNYSVGKLYTASFFKVLGEALAPGGAAVIQSTSPLFARQSYWCVDTTLKAAGFKTVPYHVYVPSFGEWGFVLASREAFALPTKYELGLKFVSPETVRGMVQFPADMSPVAAEVNKLNNQVLVRYYEEEWGRYVQ